MPMQGVVPILVTPFDDRGHVDYESLERLTEFNLCSGAHGIGIAMGSEIYRLTEDERSRVTRTVVSQVRQRVPVVVNTGGAGTDLAVFYSRQAVDDGADIVMAAPPSGMGIVTPEGIKDYYRSIAAAVNVPVMIQDIALAQVPPALVRETVDGSFRPWYCKVETPPTPARVASTLRETDGTVDVFGGANGNYFIEEMKRGSIGTMPGCSMPATFVRIWDLFQSGNAEGAMSAFTELVLPVNRLAAFSMDHFFHVHKHILQRRGIIASAHVRTPTVGLDEMSIRELDEVTERVFSHPLSLP